MGTLKERKEENSPNTIADRTITSGATYHSYLSPLGLERPVPVRMCDLVSVFY